MYSVFGDESSDQTRKRVFAVSGLFGSDDDWTVFRTKWTERTGGQIFHAAECDSDRGEYKKTSHQANKSLYKDLTKIIAESKLMGWGVAVSLLDYEQFFANALPDQPYHLCFHSVVTRLACLGGICLPPGLVTFTFDRNLETQYHARSLYQFMRRWDDWPFHKYMAQEISFGTREEIGIQAADLVAREAMKELDRDITGIPRNRRMSLIALTKSGRLKFELRTREWCEDGARFHQSQQKPGHSIDKYHAWRAVKGLNDDSTNRIRYQAYLLEMERGQREEA